MIVKELPKGDIWLTADTHFEQDEVLDFFDVDSGSKEPMRGRRFDSITEMGEFIASRWSERIKPGDSLWHLGDFAVDKPKAWKWVDENIAPVLKGVTCTILLGNHDNGMKLAETGLFDNIEGDIDARAEFGFYATHEPLHPDCLWHWERKEPPAMNVHGHEHKFDDCIGPQWFNVCVERTDYAPIHLDEILEWVKKTRDGWDPSNYGPKPAALAEHAMRADPGMARIKRVMDRFS